MDHDLCERCLNVFPAGEVAIADNGDALCNVCALEREVEEFESEWETIEAGGRPEDNHGCGD